MRSTTSRRSEARGLRRSSRQSPRSAGRSRCSYPCRARLRRATPQSRRARRHRGRGGSRGLRDRLIIALTIIGLQIADAISTDILAGSTHTFWNTVSTAWGHEGFGGFGSSALAALIALVEVFGALFVWLELIVARP